MGLLASAIERPRTNVFDAEPNPTLHEKAAARCTPSSLARTAARLVRLP
ncbi:hypothetical protein AB0939_22840 [Streptomyces sp. NPDC006990]